MEVKLVVLSGKHAGTSLPVAGPKFFIGRAEDCNLRPHSDLVSRHHCVILLEEGLVAVRDFGSKNGTYVNGERVRAEQTLKPGDVLKVGDLELKLQAESAQRAGLSVKGEEFDVGEMIGAETRRVAAETETKVLAPSSPEIVPTPPPVPLAARTSVFQPDGAPKTENRKEDDKKQEAVETRAGWRVTRKPTSVSSREAAAEMLKQLFRRHTE